MRKIVRLKHYMVFRNVSSLYRIDVCKPWKSFRDWPETASQRPATLKGFRTHELAIEMQTLLLELSNFQPICSFQLEIPKKFCRFQVREKGVKLNSATQNVIAWLLDTTPGYSDGVFKLTIKEVFTVCRETFCSINGAPIGRFVDENLRKRAMLAQAETENVQATYTKAKFALIQPISLQQTVEIENRLIRCRAGQVITRTHQ